MSVNSEMASESSRDVLTTVQEGMQDKGFVVTRLDDLMNWARTGSLWPMTFGLA